MEEVIHELLGYERLKIVQNKNMFAFSTDSMLLADFVDVKGKKMIIDLGTGNAPIPIFLTLKTDSKIIGVELQKEVALLAVKSVNLNKLNDQIEIINADLKNIYKTVGANVFDVVISNPPFFKYTPSSIINKEEYLTIARHEAKVTLEDIIIEASRLLVTNGSIFMVHRTSRISEVISTLNKYHFGIKKIRFIYSKENDESLMFLIEAKYNRKDDVKVLKPLIIYNEKNEWTEEVKEKFNFKEGRNK